MTYAGMIKQSRHTTIRTMPLINFTKNTAAMLYGIEAKTAYQSAFDSIRQLAVHLRNSVVHKTKVYFLDLLRKFYILTSKGLL